MTRSGAKVDGRTERGNRTKAQIVALNKVDLPSVRQRAAEVESRFAEMGVRLHRISAKTGEGVEDLMEAAAQKLQER